MLDINKILADIIIVDFMEQIPTCSYVCNYCGLEIWKSTDNQYYGIDRTPIYFD